MKQLAALWLILSWLIASTCWASSGSPTPTGIVATTSPHIPGKGHLQNAPDVGFTNFLFTESDLQIRWHGNPEPEMIWDCTSDPLVHCAAHEARTSPDGSKIVFAVSYAREMTIRYGVTLLKAVTHSHLHLYDVKSGKITKIPNQSSTVINRQADWVDSDTIVYSSNAANVYPIKKQYSCHRGRYADGTPRWAGGSVPWCDGQSYEYGHHAKAMQIWRMNIDGTEQENLAPHDYMALTPTVLKNGLVLYSCLVSQEDKSYDKAPRHSNNPGTDLNLFWLCAMYSDGTDATVVLGGHKMTTIPKKALLKAGITGGQWTDSLLAVRSVEQVGEWIYLTTYYRRNHLATGVVLRFKIKDHRVEGLSILNNYPLRQYNSARPGSAGYMPSTLQPVTPFGVGQDVEQHRDPQGRYLGKAGFTFALRNGQIGATYSKGWCYNQPSHAFPNDKLDCIRGLYRIKTVPVTDPFDKKQFAPLWVSHTMNIWDGNLVEFTDEPAPPPPRDESKGCFLNIVDATKAEMHPQNPFDWQRTMYQLTANQGAAVAAWLPNYHAENIHSIGIWRIEHWTAQRGNPAYQAASAKHGYMRKYRTGQQRLMADGSVRVQVPCEQPFQLSGLDRHGTVIAHDAQPMTLRKGEERFCHGCHDGHSEERAAELGVQPEKRWPETLASKTNPPLLDGRWELKWKHVQPIITKRCGGACHKGFENDPLLYSRMVEDYEQRDMPPWVTRYKSANGDNKLTRPYFSAWVARFPNWSPLYWYCRNERTDGVVNSQHPNDIDFHDGHPDTGATDKECRWIAEFINQGAAQ